MGAPYTEIGSNLVSDWLLAESQGCVEDAVRGCNRQGLPVYTFHRKDFDEARTSLVLLGRVLLAGGDTAAMSLFSDVVDALDMDIDIPQTEIDTDELRASTMESQIRTLEDGLASLAKRVYMLENKLHHAPEPQRTILTTPKVTTIDGIATELPPYPTARQGFRDGS